MTEADGRADWRHRADVLYQKSVLSRRQAEVQALTEQGRDRPTIAETLGISVYTVDEHRSKIDRKLSQAEWTTRELCEGVEVTDA